MKCFAAACLTILSWGWQCSALAATLTLQRGETLGIVSESGSGKTTLGMALLVLQDMAGGSVTLDGVLAMLDEVGLSPRHGVDDVLQRYPHEFSGGQRQRIAIARAVVLEPEILVLDEPTSALDVSVQQQVLALLAELQQRRGLSFIFISHDLAVIRAMAHRVLVMKNGDIIEERETLALFDAPRGAYTRELLAAANLA